MADPSVAMAGAMERLVLDLFGDRIAALDRAFAALGPEDDGRPALMARRGAVLDDLDALDRRFRAELMSRAVGDVVDWQAVIDAVRADSEGAG